MQLDGLRAIAMIAICWDHWCPETWPRIFPFEIFLFFFLVLTGYLITGSLLRERDRNESKGGPWLARSLKVFQIRRGLRILAPYYAALALAWIVRAPDVTGWNIGWYAFHLSNIHMAILGDWPDGTNHFWSLAIQQQFYLIWPFVIWCLPRKFLLPAMLIFTAVGPVTRMYHDSFSTWVAWPQLLTWSSFDYFGIGGILAWFVHRGLLLDSERLRWSAITTFAAYLGIFWSHQWGFPSLGLRPLQQTCLAISMCGVIAIGSTGISGPIGRLLEMPWIQRIGQLSYGVYLFHNLAPLVTGKLFWFLWDERLNTPWLVVLRILLYALVTWALTLASWRWIEKPLQAVRSKFAPPVAKLS